MLCTPARLSIRPGTHPSTLALQMGQEIRVKYKGRDPETDIIGDAMHLLIHLMSSRLLENPLSSPGMTAGGL